LADTSGPANLFRKPSCAKPGKNSASPLTPRRRGFFAPSSTAAPLRPSPHAASLLPSRGSIAPEISEIEEARFFRMKDIVTLDEKHLLAQQAHRCRGRCSLRSDDGGVRGFEARSGAAGKQQPWRSGFPHIRGRAVFRGRWNRVNLKED